MRLKIFLLFAVIVAATVHAMAWDYQIDYATMASGSLTTPLYEEGSTMTAVNVTTPIWGLPTYDYYEINPIGTITIPVKVQEYIVQVEEEGAIR